VPDKGATGFEPWDTKNAEYAWSGKTAKGSTPVLGSDSDPALWTIPALE
jgi:hypothetical protein